MRECEFNERTLVEHVSLRLSFPSRDRVLESNLGYIRYADAEEMQKRRFSSFVVMHSDYRYRGIGVRSISPDLRARCMSLTVSLILINSRRPVSRLVPRRCAALAEERASGYPFARRVINDTGKAGNWHDLG